MKRAMNGETRDAPPKWIKFVLYEKECARKHMQSH